MSRIAYTGRDEVKPTRRRPITKARKRRCHAFHNGICQECGKPVEMLGQGVVYDHFLTLWDGGPDDDGPNLRPIHKACDKPKTSADASNRGHTKRLIKKAVGALRKPSRIKSRGFDQTRRKRMDGTVEIKLDKDRC